MSGIPGVLNELRAEWQDSSSGKPQREISAIVLDMADEWLRAEVERTLDSWYERYRRSGRIDEDVYLALRNRLIPPTPGEPVQFRELGKPRWFNGTFEGPVLNPDDPNRAGDVIVVSPAGRRVPVFLSSVRRRP